MEALAKVDVSVHDQVGILDCATGRFRRAVVAFHLITLPVEFNASSRGLKVLENSGILQGEENTYAKKVLGAAALTYVASAAAMSLQLLRLLILTRGYRNND